MFSPLKCFSVTGNQRDSKVIRYILSHPSCSQVLDYLRGKPNFYNSVSKGRQSIKSTPFYIFLHATHHHSIYMPHVLPLDPQNMSAQKENTLTKASQGSKINVSLNNAEHLC